MKKFIIRPMVFLAICVLGKEKAFAQAPIWADNHDTSFQDGFLKQKQYNQRLYNQMTDSAQKAHHIKEYYRWTGFWQNRADYTRNPNGDMNTADLMAAGTLGNPICDASVNGRIWRYAGHIAGPQEKRYALTGKGVVYSVFVDTLGDPTFNTIYIGTGNGLWKTTNANDSIPAWYNMLEKERIAGVAVNDIEVVHYPNQDQPWIFIATGLIHGFGHSTSSYGVGVLKSEDGGKSWKKTALTYAAENKKLTWEIVRHPSNPNRFFALTQNEVLETKNRFQTVQLRYRHRFEKKYARDMVFHPTDTSRAYVTFDANQRGTSAYGQIFYFEVDNPDPDWRNHWHDITQRIGVNQNQGNVLRFDLAVSKAAPNHLYVSSQNKAYISRDNAQTFSPFRGNSFSVGASWWKNDFQVSPTDSATAYKGGIYISKTNNLKNWTDIQKPLHVDQRRILVLKGLDGKDWVYSCNDGDLGISYDGGNTWKRVSEHCTDSCLNITQIFGFDLDKNGQCMAYGCQDLGNYASNNTSQNWKKLNIGGDGYGVEYNLWGENFLLWANDYALLFKNCLNNREEIGYLTEDHKRNPQHEFINGQLYFLHHKRFWRSKKVEKDMKQELMQNKPPHFTNLLHLGVAESNEDVAYVAREEALFRNITDKRRSKDSAFLNRIYRVENLQNPKKARWIPVTFDSATKLDLYGVEYQAISDIIVHPEDHLKVWVFFGGFTPGRRAYYSENGGQTWTSVSKGLPNFPINTAVFQKGSLGTLYVGTDVGVYYNNDAGNPNSPWQCFNKALPVAIVSDLEIDYCQAMIYAATFGRGLWRTELAEPKQSLEINHNTTWKHHRVVAGDVVVKKGKTLTIENKAQIRLVPGAKIVVERGGHLVAKDSAKLINYCDQFWDGIYVQGTSSTKQNDLNGHGRATLLSGATLEGAKTAIRNYGLTPDGKGDYRATGGIVQADQAIFRNNKRDIEFWKYVNYNPQDSTENFMDLSFFKACHFLTDMNYLGAIQDTLKNNVTLWGVNQVRFWACHFEDQRPMQRIDFQNRRPAIATVNASYSILEKNSLNLSGGPGKKTPCTFKNVKYAIRSMNNLMNPDTSFVLLKPIRIENAHISAFGGIEHSGIQNATLTGNRLQVKSTDLALHRQVESYGIYLNDCDGYQLENNAFVGDRNTASPRHYAVGLVHGLNRERNNRAYRNTFDNLQLAAQAVGWNKSDDVKFPNFGLQYRCNHFADSQSNGQDLYVAKDGQKFTALQTGLPHQGRMTKPAANLFGVYHSGQPLHLHNQGTHFQYFHHDTTVLPRAVPRLQKKITNVDTRVSTIYCPSEIVRHSGDDWLRPLKKDLEKLEAMAQKLKRPQENKEEALALHRAKDQWLGAVLRAAGRAPGDGFESIVAPALQLAHSPHAAYQLAALYDGRGQREQATQVLAAIPQKFALTATQAHYHQDFVALRALLCLWVQAGKNLAQLSTKDLATLQGYYAKNNGIATQVLPYLQLNHAVQYYPPIVRPNPQDDPPEAQAKVGKNPKTTSQNASLLVYPNPTTGRANINYHIKEAYRQATLQVFSLQGKLLYQKILDHPRGSLQLQLNKGHKGHVLVALQIDGKTSTSRTIQVHSR